MRLRCSGYGSPTGFKNCSADIGALEQGPTAIAGAAVHGRFKARCVRSRRTVTLFAVRSWSFVVFGDAMAPRSARRGRARARPLRGPGLRSGRHVDRRSAIVKMDSLTSPVPPRPPLDRPTPTARGLAQGVALPEPAAGRTPGAPPARRLGRRAAGSSAGRLAVDALSREHPPAVLRALRRLDSWLGRPRAWRTRRRDPRRLPRISQNLLPVRSSSRQYVSRAAVPVARRRPLAERPRAAAASPRPGRTATPRPLRRPARWHPTGQPEVQQPLDEVPPPRSSMQASCLSLARRSRLGSCREWRLGKLDPLLERQGVDLGDRSTHHLGSPHSAHEIHNNSLWYRIACSAKGPA